MSEEREAIVSGGVECMHARHIPNEERVAAGYNSRKLFSVAVKHEANANYRGIVT